MSLQPSRGASAQASRAASVCPASPASWRRRAGGPSSPCAARWARCRHPARGNHHKHSGCRWFAVTASQARTAASSSSAGGSGASGSGSAGACASGIWKIAAVRCVRHALAHLTAPYRRALHPRARLGFSELLVLGHVVAKLQRRPACVRSAQKQAERPPVAHGGAPRRARTRLPARVVELCPPPPRLREAPSGALCALQPIPLRARVARCCRSAGLQRQAFKSVERPRDGRSSAHATRLGMPHRRSPRRPQKGDAALAHAAVNSGEAPTSPGATAHAVLADARAARVRDGALRRADAVQREEGGSFHLSRLSARPPPPPVALLPAAALCCCAWSSGLHVTLARPRVLSCMVPSPARVPDAVGGSSPPQPEASSAERRDWAGSVRTVGSDAELREALLEAQAHTVGGVCAACRAPRQPSAQRRRAPAGGGGLQRRVVREVQSRGARCGQPERAGAALRVVHWPGGPALTLGACAQHPELRFVIADADFLPEMAADIRFTPTFSFYQRGKKARSATTRQSRPEAHPLARAGGRACRQQRAHAARPRLAARGHAARRRTLSVAALTL